MSVMGSRAADLLRSRMPDAVLGVREECGEAIVAVPAGRLVDVALFLRDDHDALYTMPILVACVDWIERDPSERFEVVYVLRSLAYNDAVRLSVTVPEDAPRVPSLERVFLGMDWHEREAYDLSGIIFEGHHDLQRILLPEDWGGHPLRKDYVSFGEPVAFTHNLEWALPEQERPDELPGEERE